MSQHIPTVMIIAGEASGDLHGAQLALALRESLPNVRISGVGGNRMRQAWVELLLDSSSWSAIGIAESLRVVPRLIASFARLRGYIRKDPPDVLVLIDFGFFNLRIARCLPDSVKVLYYFPPGSWRKNTSYPHLVGVADRVVTPFAWSEAALLKEGFQAYYFGHPLLDVVMPALSRDQFCKKYGLDPGRPIIGLLPGSRMQEMSHNLPAVAVAAARLLQSDSSLQFVVPLASSVSINAVRKELDAVPWIEAEACDPDHDTKERVGASCSLGLANRARAVAREDGFDTSKSLVRIKLLPGMAYDVLAHARGAVVSSGTATVEAAILGCPMVIIYRGSRLTGLEYRLRGASIKYIGMPNIILDREVCPELLQDSASPRAIAELMSNLIPDTPARARMLEGLTEVRSSLGDAGAVRKTAAVVAEMLG